jgi:hypothetical protein
MSCFLCAYGRKRTPKTPDKIEGVTPPPPPETLGTCWRCSVHACSAHGSRPGQFVCAICEGADVVQATISPDADALSVTAAATIPKAAVRGQEAPARLVGTVEQALELLTRAGRLRPSHEERLALAFPGEGVSDLVLNLSEAIREVAAVRRAAFSAPVSGLDRLPEGLVDTVGGAVRERFAGREIVIPPAAALIVTGALVLAVEVADDSEDPFEAALRPPWELSDPLLLDPVMWMVSTAVLRASMGMGALTS